MTILERFVVLCVVLLTPVFGSVEEKAALLPLSAERESTRTERESTLLLLRAVREGQTVAVTALLAEGVSPNASLGGEEDNVLTTALKYRQPLIAKLLLLSGADVNAKSEHGVTALMSAACQDKATSIEMVQLLLQHGADPNVIGTHQLGKTALMFAADRAHTDVVVALLKKGADPNIATTEHGDTALYFAAFFECQEGLATVRALLEGGANPNQLKMDGTAPLMISAQEGCTEAVVALLEHGALSNVADEDGKTPLILAVQQETVQADCPIADTVRALINGGAACVTDHPVSFGSYANNEARGSYTGHTALIRAAQLWHPKSLRVLLEKCTLGGPILWAVAENAFMEAAKSTNHGTSAQGVEVFLALSAVSPENAANWIHTARTLALNCVLPSTGATFLQFLQLKPLLNCEEVLCSKNACSARDCPKSPHNAECGVLFDCLPADRVVVNLGAKEPAFYCYDPEVLGHTMATDPMTREPWNPIEIPVCPNQPGCDDAEAAAAAAAAERLVKKGQKTLRNVVRGNILQGVTKGETRRMARRGGLS